MIEQFPVENIIFQNNESTYENCMHNTLVRTLTKFFNVRSCYVQKSSIYGTNF